MKKTIYIAGKVTGLQPELTALKFKTAQHQLESTGFDVVNPIELINNPNEDWEVAMNKCIEALKLCDAIVLLPCWQDSKGACIEQKLAEDLEIPIFNYSKYGLEVLNKNLI
jgi:hypothetical protein